MASLVTKLRTLMAELVEDTFLNRFLPRATSVDELCWAWGRRAITGELRCEELPPPNAAVIPYRSQYKPYVLADVRERGSRKLFTVISTFAGAGGSSLGYQSAGGEVRIAVEFGTNPVLTYRCNNPGALVEQKNIRDIIVDPVGVERSLRSAGFQAGEPDLLDTSPPCTEFSVAGRGIGDQGRVKVHSGVKQTDVASLPFAYVEFLHRARPKTSVMENVEGLVIVTPELLESILDALRFVDGKRAYYVNWKVLSASDYGVPQRRRRVIIISIRKDVAEAVGIHSDRDVLGVFPLPTTGMVSIRSALEGLQQTENDLRPYWRSIRLSPLPRLLRQLPKCPPKHTRLKNVTTNFTLVRTSWDLPAPTLVVTGQKPDRLCGAIHPEEDRKFTIPELKRLFGLPDDFILTGTVEQAVECICNMVPPLMTKAIAESIWDNVLRPHKESQSRNS
jgi:DNA-cytosine methyltransferase